MSLERKRTIRLTPKEYHDEWEVKGLCRNCGKREAFNNKKYCSYCTSISTTRKRKLVQTKGICSRCGTSLDMNEPYSRCYTCREKGRQYGVRVKQACFVAYGNQCVCCGETEIVFLTIDHIFNDGHNHRKELPKPHGVGFYNKLKKEGYPKDRFQLLCMNCNFAKQIAGVCPHNKNN